MRFLRRIGTLALVASIALLQISTKDCIAAPNSSVAAEWNKRLSFPSREEIDNYNNSVRNSVRDKDKTAYMLGWLDVNDKIFTEYTIDFKSDYLPKATYVCSGQWELDHSYIKKKYASVEGGDGYGGLQVFDDGSTKAIMSVWDVKCKNKQGKLVKTIHPKRLYPTGENNRFDGEGEGGNLISSYPFQAGTWYRMILKCTRSKQNGHAIFTEWFVNLKTGKKTKFCSFDAGIRSKGFVAPGVFLENFTQGFSGEIRTMEYKNVKIKEYGKSYWTSVLTTHMEEGFGWNGSYNYGVTKDTFWMISTGVGNRRKKNQSFTIKHYALDNIIYGKYPNSKGKFTVKCGKSENVQLWLTKGMNKNVKKVTYRIGGGKDCLTNIKNASVVEGGKGDFFTDLGFTGRKKGSVSITITLVMKNGQKISFTFQGKVI